MFDSRVLNHYATLPHSETDVWVVLMNILMLVMLPTSDLDPEKQFLFLTLGNKNASE
jgi:hypothetical protein